jgi:hypothetical protein
MKPRIAFILLALSSVCLPCAAQVYGDADGNGSVSGADVAAVARIASGLTGPTPQARHYADVAPLNLTPGSFGNGRLELADAVRIARRIAGLEPDPWPAPSNAYMLEVGNQYVTRKYDASGTATTGPGTSAPDITTRIDRRQQETVGGATYDVFVLLGSDGSEQHLAPTTWMNEATGKMEPAIVATQGTMGGTSTAFNPPIALLVEPLQAGSRWSGTTTPSALGSSAPYTGAISGPETVVTPAGTFTNAWKVTIKYTYSVIGFPGSGEEYAWLAPYVGPAQHGYTRSAPLSSTKTVIPDIRLVSADVHGVLWP